MNQVRGDTGMTLFKVLEMENWFFGQWYVVHY